MEAAEFIDLLGCDFFAGVPDSLLKPLYGCLLDRYGTDARHHVIAANEGNCAALAAGYHLATGKIPAVYLQNSGEGNIINPLASLLSEEVYGIPVLFVIGWRGEPGVHDEPQHIFQGKVTLKLLEDMEIAYFVMGRETTKFEVEKALAGFRQRFSLGKSAAIVVRKGALSYDGVAPYCNGNTLQREEIIRRIVSAAGKDFLISTTGKTSRELFEIREARGEGHGRDFLTVGSMGHSSSIALEIAMQRPDKKIWCIDGDGAAIMHMGAMAVIGQARPGNFVHVVINNEAHESVGGAPTVAKSMDFAKLAASLGYERAESVSSMESLEKALAEAKISRHLTFLEVKCAIGARKDLGRPTTTPKENKRVFMEALQSFDL